MDKIKLAKSATHIVVGTGVARIVGQIVKNNVAVETAVQKTTVFAGTFVITQLISDQADVYTDTIIDKAIAGYRDIFHNETP